MCETVRTAGVLEAVGTSARTVPPFTITLSYPGIFVAEHHVIDLGVMPTRRLLQFYEEFHHTFMGQAIGAWDYYMPGKSVSHFTVPEGIPVERLPAAVALCRHFPLPVIAQIETVALVKGQSGKLVERFRQTGQT